jgi:hypothetical protein
LEAGAGPAADEQAEDVPQQPGNDPGDGDEADRQDELVKVVLSRTDEVDAEDPGTFDVTGICRWVRSGLYRVQETADRRELLHEPLNWTGT